MSDLYQAEPCLKAGPRTCGPIAGWNLHPYGLPYSTTEGIASVPPTRGPMLSGRDNIVVSEIGFCAQDVNAGSGCQDNRPDIVTSSGKTATWLAETLTQALAMHRAGWLKALLIWNRAGDGWAMQQTGGALTSAGAVLVHFASGRGGAGTAGSSSRGP